jgi:predicted dehydrogenase
MVPERPGPDGPEPVTVDDAAWATLELDGGAIASVEASRMATGAKNELALEVYGTKGALRFDLERLDELWFLDATAPVAEQGFARVLVTEPEHPYLEGWWPQGHILGWENAFTNQARDLLLAVRDRDPAAYSPDFEDGLALQRILEAVIASHRADGATVCL